MDALLDGLVANYDKDDRASLPTVLGHVARWRETIGAARAVQLATARVQHVVVQWKRERTSPATINRRLAALRRAFRLAKLLDPDRLDFAELMLPENSPRGRYSRARATD